MGSEMCIRDSNSKQAMFSNCCFFVILLVVLVVCALSKPGGYGPLRDAALRAFDNGINILSYDARSDNDVVETASRSSTKTIAQRPRPHETRTMRKRVSNHISREVASRQKFRCAACNEMLTSDWEIDHVIPTHRGGAHDISNMQALHRRCHQMKNSLEQRRRQL